MGVLGQRPAVVALVKAEDVLGKMIYAIASPDTSHLVPRDVRKRASPLEGTEIDRRLTGLAGAIGGHLGQEVTEI